MKNSNLIWTAFRKGHTHFSHRFTDDRFHSSSFYGYTFHATNFDDCMEIVFSP